MRKQEERMVSRLFIFYFMKKFLLHIITATILLILCCKTSSASTWLDHGNYSLTWYSNSSKADEFTISSEKELAGLAYIVNNGYSNFSNKTIKLEKDLDVSAHTWIGIGKDRYCFKGTFQGQGHKIEGVRLTEESGTYPYYGFWNNIIEAKIKDLTIQGIAVLTFSTAAYPNTTFGMFAAKASSCSFENCNSIVDISYFRSKTNNFTYSIYIGGLVGTDENSSMIYCNHRGDINIDFGRSGIDSEFYDKSSSVYVGGLVADASKSIIEYCGNSSENIKIDAAGSVNTTRIPISLGGIIGYAHDDTKLSSCFNNSKQFETISRGSGNASIQLGGIAASARYYSTSKGGVYNCYSSTNKYNITVQRYASNVNYGGVVANYNSSTTNKYKACYSPVDLSVYSLISFNTTKGYSGSDAYTSSQMKTDDFLSELNLYLSLNDDNNNIWVRDEGFPYIKKNNNDSKVTHTREQKSMNFVIEGGRLKFDEPTDMRIYSTEGFLEYSGKTLYSCPLANGIHILKIGNKSKTFYIR